MRSITGSPPSRRLSGCGSLTETINSTILVLPLLLVVTAWFMVFAVHRLRFTAKECRIPWRLTGLIASAVALIVAFVNVADGYIPAISLLAIGILYFADTLLSQDFVGFYPAGIVTAWGLWLLLRQAQVNNEIITIALCLLVATYFLAGLEAERRKIPVATFWFLAPLYNTAHLLALVILIRIYIHPLDEFLGGPDG